MSESQKSEIHEKKSPLGSRVYEGSGGKAESNKVVFAMANSTGEPLVSLTMVCTADSRFRKSLLGGYCPQLI